MQMSQERQAAMNKLVEEVLHTDSIITCPRVNRHHSSDSSGVNVADLDRMDCPTINGSDDSCKSIILAENKHKSSHEKLAKPTASDNRTKIKIPRDAAGPRFVGKENMNIDQLAIERKKIEKREQEVNAKERTLEQTLLKMFQENQQRSQPTAASVKVQTDKGLEKNVHVTQADTPDAPVQIIIQVNGGAKRKVNKYVNKASKVKPVVPLRDKPSQVFPKTPAKCPLKESIGAVADGSSTSTAYQSLPKVIRTDLTDVLQSNKEQAKGGNTNQKEIIAASALQQYIRRLLGISRASIDQLEVSEVSSVATPSSSLMNISTNVSYHNSEATIEDAHIDKLRSFIQDNHSFISDLEKSLKELSLSGREEADIKAVESAWMHTLAKKEKEMKKGKRDSKRPTQEARHQSKTVIRPILKKPASPKKVQVVETESQQKPRQVVHNERFEASTQSCNKRIADLNEMIVQVRREKQRLLENTYSSMGSSVSEPCQNSTEYIEIGKKARSDGSHNSSRTTTELPSLSDERKVDDTSSLVASKQIGVSRDSGLGGTSRPMTASDVPGNSPDLKLSGKTNEEPENFQCNTIEQQMEPIEANSPNKRKPPSSLIRFGPHIEHLELGHDLSTITEVDTPVATSRMNTSLTDTHAPIPTQTNSATLAHLLLEISSNTRQKLQITSFHSPPNAESNDTTSYSATKQQLEIRPFPSHSSFAEGVSGLADTASILTVNETGKSQSQLEPPMAIRSFPTHKEYAKQTSGLCTSASVAAALDENYDSFPDIEAELKKRNLLQHSFDSISFESNGDDRQSDFKMPTLSTSSSDNLEEEMQKMGINWASSMIKKSKIATHAMTSSSSNDEPLQSKPLKSILANTAVDRTQLTNTSANASNKSTGKPMNLKEFLARELLKRSNTLSSSSAHDDSTLASQFLRSLLGTSSENSSKHSAGLVYMSERHRTSTPVKDVQASTPGRPVVIVEEVSSRSKSATYQLFSGESGLSSVRGSTLTSSEKDDTSHDTNSTSGACLNVPNLQMRSGPNSSSS